jgi:predicted RND superfamily exporter protein
MSNPFNKQDAFKKTIKANLLTKRKDELADEEETRRIIRKELMDQLEGGSFWSDMKEYIKKGVHPQEETFTAMEELKKDMKGGRTRMEMTSITKLKNEAEKFMRPDHMAGNAKGGYMANAYQRYGMGFSAGKVESESDEEMYEMPKKEAVKEHKRLVKLLGKHKDTKVEAKKQEKELKEISGGKAKLKKRGEMVKKIMKEKGMNLAQASKYIKENNLI